eukprot:3397036-Amphidinium_carterae.1
MVEEEYWNRMIATWRFKNDLRREQAKMIAKLKDVPLDYGEFGEMPMYLKVPVSHRFRRFQLGKLKIILRELQEAEAAALKEAKDAEEVEMADATPSTPLPLVPMVTESTEDPLEVGSTFDGLSPRHLDDVPVDDEDDAAQLVASQSSDGSAHSASAAIASAAHQRKMKGQKQSPPTLPSSMPTVPEEAAPPSDHESYRSANEQSEAVPEE